MIHGFCSRFRRPVWWTSGRAVAMGIAIVMLIGALLTPWGMARSHGAAAFAMLEHGESWSVDDGHGHSHEDDVPSSDTLHAHHAGDHSHDHAHALPMGLPGLNEVTAMWQEHPVHPGPRPSLDGLERPPRS